MDEIAVDEARHELTMLKLSDDVCRDVSQAITWRRSVNERKHDLLSDILKVVEQRDAQ